MKKYLSELIGTFALVFFGTGAIIVNDFSNNAFGLVGIAITFGLIVTVMIYIFGQISGAHINPAVTVAYVFKKEIKLWDAFFYMVFQIIGAILASLTLHFLFKNHKTLGVTLPSGSVMQSFMMEIISTFFLMITILGVTEQKSNIIKSISGIIIGFVVLAMIFVAGPISGGSFNPARSIGPALVSGNLDYLWIYLSAPFIATILAVFVWNFLKT